MTQGRLTAAGTAALILLAGALLAACGGNAGRPQTARTPPGRADTPARVPAGWTLDANGPSGFSIGVPPSWATSLDGSSTVLYSPGRLVVVSIGADRTEEATRAALDGLARETAAHLTGFRDLRPGPPHAFASRYDALAVSAEATRTSGERQRLELIVMRGGGAVFSLLAAANQKVSVATLRSISGRIARTLRYQPVEVTG